MELETGPKRNGGGAWEGRVGPEPGWAGWGRSLGGPGGGGAWVGRVEHDLGVSGRVWGGLVQSARSLAAPGSWGSPATALGVRVYGNWSSDGRRTGQGADIAEAARPVTLLLMTPWGSGRRREKQEQR